MIYGAGIILPLLLGLIMKVFGGDTPIALVMTGYGYALTVFIPITFICIIPSFVRAFCALVGQFLEFNLDGSDNIFGLRWIRIVRVFSRNLLGPIERS